MYLVNESFDCGVYFLGDSFNCYHFIQTFNCDHLNCDHLISSLVSVHGVEPSPVYLVD